MPYSLAVRWSGWSSTVTRRLSILTTSLPVRIVDSEWPFERRMIAWTRAISSRRAQPAQHFVPVDVGQHQIQDDDVVIVELADLQAVLAEIGGIANEAFPF